MLKRKRNKKIFKRFKFKKKFKIKNLILFNIFCTFNNTIINISNFLGNVLYWNTSSNISFKFNKKSNTAASQMAAEKVAKFALDLGYKYSKIFIKGVGFGRDYSMRGIFNSGIIVLSVHDLTPIPHNGCKFKKIRRN